MKFILIGILSGIISGMGIGGGTILIPALIIFGKLSQQEAQGINLIVFIPVAIAALIVHIKQKNIDLKLAFWIIISGVLGAILGSKIALKINSDTLRRFFALFLLFVGIYELLAKNDTNKK